MCLTWLLIGARIESGCACCGGWDDEARPGLIFPRGDIFHNRTEMKSLQPTIKVMIRRGEESGYVAECVEIAVITQGQTLDEVTRNLQEAVPFHLEGEDLA